MLTEFFAADDIETHRLVGLALSNALQNYGEDFSGLVTFGVWSDATTTLAQLAAKVTHWESSSRCLLKLCIKE